MNKREMAINTVRNSRLLNTTNMNLIDYSWELINFQNALAEIALDKKKDEYFRIDYLITHLQMEARKKHLNNHPVYYEAINSLKKANREINITLAGRNGERSVKNILNNINNNNITSYQNVFVQDAENSTEIDGVVVTNRGILILEVKRTKEDIVITKDGFIYQGNDKCFEKKPIDEKMSLKRRLLKKTIEQELKKRKVSIEVPVDSYVVFTTPKDQHIWIDDYFRKEKNCRHGKLKYIVNEYESGIKYSDKELDVLNDILKNIKTNQKELFIGENFKKIFNDFMGLMNLLESVEDPTVVKETRVLGFGRGFFKRILHIGA